MASWEPKKSHGWALEIENTGHVDSIAKDFSDLTQRRGRADGVEGEAALMELEPAVFPPPAHHQKTV